MKVTKKILGLFVLLGLGISSTFAVNTVNCGNVRWGNATCGELNVGEITTILGNNYNSIGQYIQFRNEDDGKSFDFKWDNGNSWNNTFWSGNELYSFAGKGTYAYLVSLKNFCLIEDTDYTQVAPTCFNGNNYNLTTENFITEYKGKQVQKYLLTNGNGEYSNSANPRLCAVYDDSIVCFYTFSYDDQGRQRNNVNEIAYLSDVGYDYAETNFTYGNTPLAGNNSGGGSNTTGSTTSGATLYCPPIKYEISMYGSKFNTGLCYSNTEEISGGQVTTVTPISIFDAFPTYQAYAQAYNLITNNCHTSTVNTQEQCQTALQTIGKKPSEILLKLINSNIQEGVQLSKIYQYCHLQLDFTEEEKWSKSTCDLKEEETYYATGVNSTTQSNPNPIQGYTDILEESDTILTPEDGSIFDSILPDGVLTWKDVMFNANFMAHFATLYTKITLMFKARPYQDGILPPVITSLLLLIILFKVYKK